MAAAVIHVCKSQKVSPGDFGLQRLSSRRAGTVASLFLDTPPSQDLEIPLMVKKKCV